MNHLPNYFRTKLLTSLGICLLTTLVACKRSASTKEAIKPTTASATSSSGSSTAAQVTPSAPDTPNPSPEVSPTPVNNFSDAINQLQEKTQAPTADPKDQEIYQLIQTSLPSKLLDTTNVANSHENLQQELVDNLMSHAADNAATPQAITWLINQKLLDPNKTDNQGKTMLEKTVETWMANPSSNQTFQQIAAAEQKLGAQIAPEKAGALVETLAEKLLVEEQHADSYLDMITFLGTQQTPQLDPAKAQDLYTQYVAKSLDKQEDPKLKPMLDLLQSQMPAVPPLSDQATQLLQEAIAENKTELYSRLLDLGADPNMEVKDAVGKPQPLLNYAWKHDHNLFKKLVTNPNTQVNKLNENGFTLAMDIADIDIDDEQVNDNLSAIRDLLQRKDLDINTIKGNNLGMANWTLLDIIVSNCIYLPSQDHSCKKQKALISNSQAWLALLKESIATHPSFFVTKENLMKARNMARKLKASDCYNQLYYQRNLQIAQEAIQILENNLTGHP